MPRGDPGTYSSLFFKESDLHDLRLLHERFGVDYPDEVADLFSSRECPPDARADPSGSRNMSIWQMPRSPQAAILKVSDP